MNKTKPDVVQEQRKSNEGGITGKGFVKGKSGNPGGRPKGVTSMKVWMEKVGVEPSSKDPDMSKDEYIARNIYKKGEDGDKWAQQFITERKDGKPNQTIDITEHEPDEVVEI